MAGGVEYLLGEGIGSGLVRQLVGEENSLGPGKIGLLEAKPLSVSTTQQAINPGKITEKDMALQLSEVEEGQRAY